MWRLKNEFILFCGTGVSSEKMESKSTTLTAIILTLNESLHIERCVCAARSMADEVLVVDSYSTDDTVVLAQRLGARILQHPFNNHADQLNWTLENGQIRTDWIMRLDADEYPDDRMASSLRSTLSQAPSDVGGFEVNRQVWFLGRIIRHGGMSPMWVTRIFRNGWARCETRWMDEHMVLSKGRVERMEGNIIDNNAKSLTWWTQKHNLYSNREAVHLLNTRYNLGIADEAGEGLNPQARHKRWLKKNVYSRLPLSLRAWLYFFYRAIFRLGFLDGPRGMMFHALQGLWYRLLVDAKVAEVELAMQQHGLGPQQAILQILGINVDRGSVPTQTCEKS